MRLKSYFQPQFLVSRAWYIHRAEIEYRAEALFLLTIKNTIGLCLRLLPFLNNSCRMCLFQSLRNVPLQDNYILILKRFQKAFQI